MQHASCDTRHATCDNMQNATCAAGIHERPPSSNRASRAAEGWISGGLPRAPADELDGPLSRFPACLAAIASCDGAAERRCAEIIVSSSAAAERPSTSSSRNVSSSSALTMVLSAFGVLARARSSDGDGVRMPLGGVEDGLFAPPSSRLGLSRAPCDVRVAVERPSTSDPGMPLGAGTCATLYTPCAFQLETVCSMLQLPPICSSPAADISDVNEGQLSSPSASRREVFSQECVCCSSSVCAGPSTSEHASLDAVSASVDSRSTSQRRGG